MAAAAEQALVPYEASHQPAIVRPLVTAQDMITAVREYEALKKAILFASDKQRIGNNDHIKKSGWLRIARAFGISVEPVREEFQTDNDDWGYAVVVRAVAPNGATMTGDGACWMSEKQEKRIPATKHNVRAHAYTRASNRAISNLVGGGEVSAEELLNVDNEAPRASARRTIAPAQPAARPHDAAAYAREARLAGDAIGDRIPLSTPEQTAIPDWPAIHNRMRAVGIDPTKRGSDKGKDRETFARWAAQTTWEGLTDSHAPKVIEAIEKIEAKHAAAEAKVKPAEPEPASEPEPEPDVVGTDLAELAWPHVQP